MSKNTSKTNKPKNNEINELLNNNNEIEKHKSVSRKENKSPKAE